MPERALTKRVEILEQRVEDLRSLPERVAGVESQILQLRGEMHGEFSAIRDEMRREFSAVRAEMHGEFSAVRAEMHGEFSAVRDELRDVRTGLGSHAELLAKLESAVATLRQDNEETRSQARMLHEEVLARIALLQEGRRRKR